MNTWHLGNDEYKIILMDLIDAPNLPSRFDTEDPGITDLAQSIDESGLLQPVVVTPEGDRFRLIAGQRRIRACRLLGWTEIIAHVIKADKPTQALGTLVENMQRADLTPLEEAVALSQMVETYEINQTALARRLGVDRTWLSHRLALLRLPENLTDALAVSGISPSVALELARISDEHDRNYYLSLAMDNGATLIVVRDWVRAWESYRRADDSDPGSSGDPPPDLPSFKPEPPACFVCKMRPPQVQLKMSYVCWGCAEALKGQGEEA